MKTGFVITILAFTVIVAGCSIVPSRSSMYRAAGDSYGVRSEQYTVMIDPYWLTGAEEGLPVEVVDLENADTYNVRWNSHKIIRQNAEGRWEIRDK